MDSIAYCVYIVPMQRFHTGVALSLRGAKLAQEVARQHLAASRSGRANVTLEDAIVLARAASLGASEIQRMAGCSRQTVYNLARQEGQLRRSVPPAPHRGFEALVTMVAAGGDVSIDELAKRLRLAHGDLIGVVGRLRDQGLVASLEPGPLVLQSAVGATPAADEVLRDHLDDFLLTRDDSFSVYMHVEHDELSALSGAADELLSRHEHDLIDVSVAPSSLSGPVLAFTVHTSSVRRALEVASDVWDDLRQMCANTAGLPPRPPRIANVIPPAMAPEAASYVLDAFCDGINEAAPAAGTHVLRARKRYAGDVDQRDLTGRCLTAAAGALRRSLGQERDPRPIHHGDAAFDEWQMVKSLHLDAARERIQRPLLDALDLATERLGPLPGGRVARLSAHGPSIVEGVEPTQADLEQIAALAGRALGHAAAFGAVDPAQAMLGVALGR